MNTFAEIVAQFELDAANAASARRVPSRVERVEGIKHSNAAGPHRTPRHLTKGGRQGARHAAIAEHS